MVRALVTGATGCVGANIVEALLTRGYEVRALRRASSRLEALSGLDPELVVGDVLDQASLSRAMVGCELVFHAAAVSRYWHSSTAMLYRVNVTGTRNVLEAARQAGVQRVVLTSSVAVLGVPTRETPIRDERSPLNLAPRRFPYAHSKLLAEAEASRAVEMGLDVVCVNPATVIGRRDINFVGGEILKIVKSGWLLAAPAGGMGVVAASMAGLGHVLAAERGSAGARYVLNGENVKHSDLLATVAEVVGSRSPLVTLPSMPIRALVAGAWAMFSALGRPLPPALTQLDLSWRDMFFDGSRARDELGFPSHSARYAVEEAWAWYKGHGLL